MAEREGPSGEYYRRRERRGELPAYQQAARFPDEQTAGIAYNQAQEAIYAGPPNELSSFRLLLNQVWHVAALGQAPPAELHDQLTGILAAGEPADLPEELLKALNERRRQSIRQSLWSEGHYRPPSNR